MVDDQMAVEAHGKNGIGGFGSRRIEARGLEIDVVGLPGERRQTGVGHLGRVAKNGAADHWGARIACAAQHREFLAAHARAEQGRCSGTSSTPNIEVESETIADDDLIPGVKVDSGVGAAPWEVVGFEAGEEFEVKRTVAEALFGDGAREEVALVEHGLRSALDRFVFFEGVEAGGSVAVVEEDNGSGGWRQAEGGAFAFHPGEAGGFAGASEGQAVSGEEGGGGRALSG
ncbi:MAG: hypothetical protein RLZZ399_1815 [Verrucomicrobiota bacterium]